MKVHLLQADGGGSGFYRMSEPARAVNEAYGEVVTVDQDLDVHARQRWDGSVSVQSVDVDCDVIVLQRPLNQSHYAIAECARAQGMAVVVELDDDFHNVHPGNAAYDAVDPAYNPWSNKNWLIRTIAQAHLLTCTTPALLKYADGARIPGRVVRNRLPASALEIAPADPAPRSVGWTGTTQTHPADLQRGRGALDRTDLLMRVVGDTTGVAAALGVPLERVSLAAPWIRDHHDYWTAIRDHIGVGIAPLESSKFNRAKSWLKPLEYATLGIPFVVSPLPEYQLIAKESGGGLVAHSAGAWARAVERIASDDGYRAELAARGRTWAESHTLESHADEWYGAWKEAREVAG